MTWLRSILRKLVGLFVEDPVLAGGVATWIVLIALMGVVAPGLALVRAVAFAVGLCVILTVSIIRGELVQP
jgi:multisubunit Na+/H+ antiporter MnhB subunit